MTPKLSYIIASRNDFHCGDSLYRLRQTLNTLQLLQPEAEVVVVDWGSDPQLWEFYSWTSVRFIHVPKSITDEFPVDFSEVHALNVGVRRARGHWIARLDQDIIIGKRYSEWAKELPDWVPGPTGTAYFSLRRDLPLVQLDERAKFLSPVWSNWPLDHPLYFRGAVGILLAPRWAWHETRGYNEKLIYRNHMEHDLCIRFRNLCGLVNLGLLTSADFYHQWHEPCRGRKENPEPLEELFRDTTLVQAPNSPDWGFGSWKFEEKGA